MSDAPTSPAGSSENPVIPTSSAVAEAIAANLCAARERLFDLLRIPSVSTDPTYGEAMTRAAAWVRDHLAASGLEASVMPTAAHDAVVARTRPDRVANPDAPTVVFYGHYDVQPPDPEDGWTTPAFEPTVRPGLAPSTSAFAGEPSVFARGSSDDKGQVLCFLEALRAYHEAGEKLPGPVTVIIEGDEECGSDGLEAFLAEQRDFLLQNDLQGDAQRDRAAVALVSDTAMLDDGRLTLTYGLRGLVYFDVKLFGPDRDLHSGVYGGTLANPATILARLLGKLFDADHRVTIPGFYDDVAPLDEAEREAWAALGFEEGRFLGGVGTQPFGEAGYSTLERRWARPTCDVNGLYGGYMGEGGKTVIPRFAGAKVSFRLPGNMDPDKVAAQFKSWLGDQLDAMGAGHMELKIEQHGRACPVLVSRDSPYVAAAVEAVRSSGDRGIALVRDGATIPVIADFQRVLGLDTLLVGFGLNADNLHSPDEHFSLTRFELGIRTHVTLLQALATVKPGS